MLSDIWAVGHEDKGEDKEESYTIEGRLAS